MMLDGGCKMSNYIKRRFRQSFKFVKFLDESSEELGTIRAMIRYSGITKANFTEVTIGSINSVSNEYF